MFSKITRENNVEKIMVDTNNDNEFSKNFQLLKKNLIIIKKTQLFFNLN